LIIKDGLKSIIQEGMIYAEAVIRFGIF